MSTSFTTKVFAKGILAFAFLLAFAGKSTAQLGSVIFAGNDTIICPGPDTLHAILSTAPPPTIVVLHTSAAGGPSMTDDGWANTISNIGFSFNFYGNNYTQCLVGANGIITFSGAFATASYCSWPINNCATGGNGPWPCSNAGIIKDAIGSPYQDLNPSMGGIIRTAILGVAPNRIFVVDYYQVPLYGNTGTCSTQQIKLFETTNNVEIHITNKMLPPNGWNSSQAIEGLHNSTGAFAEVPPGRNAVFPTGSWVCVHDAYKFEPTSSVSYIMTPIPYNPVFLSDPTGGIIVNWFEAGNPVSIYTGLNCPINPVSTTTYTAQATWPAGCNNPVFSDTIVVTVGNPNLNLGPDQTVCPGGQTVLHATDGGTNYLWSPYDVSAGFPGVLTPGSVIPADSLGTFMAGPTSQIIVTADMSGCVAIDTVLITVQPLSTLAVTPAAPVICELASVTLNVVGASVYTWSPGTGLNTTSGATVIASPSSTTTYTVTGSAAGCPNPITTTVTVTVNPAPILTFTPPPPMNLCSGHPATAITFTTSTPTTATPTWSPTTGLVAPATGANVTFTGTLTTTYTIHADASGCTTDTPYLVNVSPTPVVSWPVPVPASYCENDAAFALTGGSALPAIGVGTYWGPGVSGGTFDPSSLVPPPAPDATIANTIWYVYDILSCKDSISNVISVSGRPVVTVVPTNPLCFNDSPLALNASPAGGTFSGLGLAASGTDFDPSLVSSAGGSYPILYSYTNPSTTCSNSATLNQVVNPLPNTVLILPTMKCVVDPVVVLDGTPSPTSPTGGSFTVDGASSASIDPTLASPGPHVVVYTFTDANGCTKSDTKTITINPLPIVNFTGLAPSYCDYDPAAALVGIPAGPTGTFSSTTNGVVAGSFDPTLADHGNNVVTYTYTDPATLCVNSINQSTLVYKKPTADFIADPYKTTLLNPQIKFMDHSLLADSWHWNFGDMDSALVMNTYHSYADTGTYTVQLIVTNHNCLDSTSKEVTIVPDFTFFMPTAFTPNSDGKNDVFMPSGAGIAEFKMVIFDRWGNDLFETNSFLKPWSADGAPPGLYIYKVEAKDYMGAPYEYVGHVSVVR